MVEYVQSACNWIASWPWQAVGYAVQSFALPLAAPFAALYVANKFGHIQAEIGRRQAETAALAMGTARNKLRLDLFEKRLAVYEATNSFLSNVRGLKNGTDADVMVLMRSTKSAIWLFDERTANHITKKILNDAWTLEDILDHLSLDPNEDEKRELLAKSREVRKRLVEHQEVLHELMIPYLRFTEDTP